MFMILWILLGVAVTVATPALAIAGFVQARRARTEIVVLRGELALLRQSPAAAALPPPEVVPEERPPTAAEPEATADPTVPPEGGDEAIGDPPPAEMPETVAARASIEEALTSRWLVWLGGIALALSGGFLVKYSIDSGLLSPGVRVLLGLLLAGALVALGDWLRRRAPPASVGRPDYIPAAVTAAGLCTAFASIYTAYALYALVGPSLAFIALGAVAFGAIALSMVQGPLVAALGVAGGYVVPALIASEQPVAWPLFTYLFFITAAGVGIVRYRGWWWLSWLSLAGAAAWTVLWTATAWRDPDSAVIGLYLVLLAALFLLLRYEGETVGKHRLPPEAVATAAAGIIALLAFMLVRVDGYGVAGILTMTGLALFYGFVGRRIETLVPVAAIGAVLVIAAIATWHMPEVAPDPLPRPPIVPPALQPFVTACLLYGAAFAAGGFVALWGTRRPGTWAGISVVTPFALLVVAYWRLTDFAVDLSWSLIGVALAGLFLAAAQRLNRYRTPYLDEALAAYAVGVAACIAFAATAALREAWLTVALALLVPAIGWIHTRLRVPSLRWIATAIAGSVLVRLVLNIDILDYGIAGPVPGLNWPLYGYGIPAVCFYVGSRLFRDGRDDPLTLLLEAAALVFAVLFVTFEIRTLVAGNLASLDYGLLEQSLQSLAWGSIAYGLLRSAPMRQSLVATWGWRILAGLAVAQIVLLQCLWDNPLWTGAPVGDLPLVNLLLLAYGLPGLLAIACADIAHRRNQPTIAMAAGGLALALILLWLSLEVRRGFQGPILSEGEPSEAEWYSYSAAWLLYAIGLLMAGIRRRVPVLRYVSLAIVLLTVLKVFLFDMSALTGLYRVLSFLGLGAALVGTGLFYQPLVLAPLKSGPATAGPA